MSGEVQFCLVGLLVLGGFSAFMCAACFQRIFDELEEIKKALRGEDR